MAFPLEAGQIVTVLLSTLSDISHRLVTDTVGEFRKTHSTVGWAPPTILAISGQCPPYINWPTASVTSQKSVIDL